MKKNTRRLYEVEVKSQSILREGKKSFITYFQGGPGKRIISNLKILYPQYMNPEDKPLVNITPITLKEYQERQGGRQIEQKAQMFEGEGDIV
jgi:hypothetical protein